MKRLTYLLILIFFLPETQLPAQENINPNITQLVEQQEKSFQKIEKKLAGLAYDSLQMKKLIELSKKNKYLQGEIFAYNMLGKTYRIKANYPKALEYHNKALKLSKEINDINFTLYSLNMIGVVYRRMDAVKSALEYHNKALQIARDYPHKNNEILENMAISHNSIGNIYLLLQKEELAYKHFTKALEIEKKFNNKLGLAINYQNIGSILKKQGKINEALEYFKKSLSYNEQIGSKLGKIICNNSIGNIYLKQNQPNKALAIMEPNIKIAQKLGDEYYISDVYINLAKVYLKLGQNDKAGELLNRALKIAINKKIPSQTAVAYQQLSLLYEKEKNFNKSLDYYKKYNEEQNKILNEKNRQLVADVIIKQIELENKEKIKELGEENKLVKKKLVRTKLTFSSLLLLSMLLLFSAIIYYKQRQLNNQRKLINMEQSMLRARMNPHFIFNSLNSIKMFIIQNKPKDAVSYLSTFAKLIRSILQSSIEKESSLKEEIETIKMYVTIENTRFSNQINFQINVSDELDLEKIKIPPLLTQPFIENALWHGLSPKKGEKKLTINIYPKNNKYLVIEIIDNGIGRKRAMEIKKSRTFKRKSIGIDLSKERLKHFSKNFSNQYNIEFIDLYDEQNQPAGTKVVIEIPMK